MQQQQQVGGILEIPAYCRQGAERTSWVPSLFPMLEIKSSRPTLGEVPGLSSTLAQGRNTKGPKSNHHFYTPDNGSSKDSAKGENWRNFFPPTL